MVEIIIILAFAFIAWWLILAPLRWSPFYDIREEHRTAEDPQS